MGGRCLRLATSDFRDVPGNTDGSYHEFPSAYYDSTNATGKLYVCGNTGANPTVYQVAISAGAFGSGQGLAIDQLATTNAACSPVTDIPNPNLPGGFSERMFVSVQNSAK